MQFEIKGDGGKFVMYFSDDEIFTYDDDYILQFHSGVTKNQIQLHHGALKRNHAATNAQKLLNSLFKSFVIRYMIIN